MLAPALGYFDKVKELVDKSANNTITPAEFVKVQKRDLAMLRYYEQARGLSKELLKKWLEKYKFAKWTKRHTTNPGAEVTIEEKEKRAEEIAGMLSNNNICHSHQRVIGMLTLRETVRLKLDDFGEYGSLRQNIRRYSDSLTDCILRKGLIFNIYITDI